MNAAAPRVLLIDDDDALAAMLVAYLGARGVTALHAPDGPSGLQRIERGDIDAVVLDVMMPGMDGWEVLRRLRANSVVPVLMLTARGEDTDRIVGLEMGADDYVGKPFNPRELLARIRAVLRRGSPPPRPAAVLRFGALEIDEAAREVRVSGTRRPLTSHQFAILLHLAQNAGRVQTRDAIFDAVRGDEFDAFDRSIDVHMSRIRAALGDDPREPRRIHTIRGVGYMMPKDQP
jgi:DNA-binding response OmpR family regulator